MDQHSARRLFYERLIACMQQIARQRANCIIIQSSVKMIDLNYGSEK